MSDSDVEWGGDITDKKSISIYYLLLIGTPIVWSSKKYTVVGQSSVEDKFRTIANSTG